MYDDAIQIRPARLTDALAIGAVHVAVWRNAYAGVLPDAYLARLSAGRQGASYQAGMMAGRSAIVAESGRRIVGFATMGGRMRGLADGEIDTLYVDDDHRDQGIGRRLMQASAKRLAAAGCRSAFLWVLHDNPSRWFYERLHGRRIARGRTTVAGTVLAKDAYAWDPIDILLHMPASPPHAPEVPD